MRTLKRLTIIFKTKQNELLFLVLMTSRSSPHVRWKITTSVAVVKPVQKCKWKDWTYILLAIWNDRFQLGNKNRNLAIVQKKWRQKCWASELVFQRHLKQRTGSVTKEKSLPVHVYNKIKIPSNFVFKLSFFYRSSSKRGLERQERWHIKHRRLSILVSNR